MACFLAPAAAVIITTNIKRKIASRYRLQWLNAMLGGGVAMLAVEHIARREIVFYPPFLTAGFSVVLPELLKVGITMTVTIILVWAVMVLAVNKIAKMRVKGSPAEYPFCPLIPKFNCGSLKNTQNNSIIFAFFQLSLGRLLKPCHQKSIRQDIPKKIQVATI